MDRFGSKADHYPRGLGPLSPAKSLKLALLAIIALVYVLIAPGAGPKGR